MKIRDIKNQDNFGLPTHWVIDWLLHVLQKPASFLITDSEYQLNEVEQSQFEAGIAQMRSGTPLAYIIGKQAFWSLEFEVNEHTLIPRPDTEVLVEQVLAWIDSKPQTIKATAFNNDKATKRLLDLGTGSGCIGISLAHELQAIAPNGWQVTAIDYSKPALEVATRNAALNDVTNIEFIHSNWYSALIDSEHTRNKPLFDVIVSNPPYIVASDEHLENLKSEPLSALVAPDNGLADIKLIAEQGRNYLVDGGLLAVEHGYDQGDRVQKIFKGLGYKQVETIKDYGGNDRVTLAIYNK
ncbi:peptide chain release factor N(5)-glutamine methyltransferase [Psychrobacter sp.]|uniref:peptide chain release factor N(5)-glutamine methyltransferase n=1 Tax=Psychrobacter sp. TaxID=56811 RepID=UPI0025D75E7B|nr:peptide chain release factor N(5)-glutamine methyltransferase [Psychrobacter sp.]